ncbi:MAG: ProQ/FINO family protein [Pseudomonadota bacterium]
MEPNIKKKTKKYVSKTPKRIFSKTADRKEEVQSTFSKNDQENPFHQHQRNEASKPTRAPRVKLSGEEKHILLTKSERVNAALLWLHDVFPNLFKEQDCLPMKIGTTHDISDWIDAHKSAHATGISAISEAETRLEIPSKTAIRDAIRMYTSKPQYQKSLQENGKRYDLNGSEFGIVEEQQKEHAGERKKENEAGTQEQAFKRQALKERRKRIAATWHVESQAKRKAKEKAQEAVTNEQCV